MATYSNNVTIKVGTPIDVVGATSYTVPANCYAIITYVNSAGSGSMTINGVDPGGGSGLKTIYVQAGGQIVQSNKLERTKGILFQNTP